MKKRIIFLLIDGIADKPQKETPLSTAKKPFLNFIFRRANSFLSYIYPLKKDNWPKQGGYSVSGLANFGILGYNIKPESFKRGPYEALGALFPYKNGWLALRANFATVDKNFVVLDRRSGRSSWGLDTLEKEINKIKLPVRFIFLRTVGHRGALIFKEKLSSQITINDPFKIGLRVKRIRPIKKDEESLKTARILNDFLFQVYKILDNHPTNLKRAKRGLLKANILLLREPGTKILKLRNFFKKYKIAQGLVLATRGVDLGTCLSLGFKPFILDEPKSIDDELRKILKSIKMVGDKFALLYIHIKKADEVSHDKNFEKKKEFFEKFDSFLKKIYNKEDIFVITGDHITSVKTGMHHFGRVPILILNSSLDNQPKDFSEITAIKKEFLFKNNENLWKFLSNALKKS